MTPQLFRGPVYSEGKRQKRLGLSGRQLHTYSTVKLLEPRSLRSAHVCVERGSEAQRKMLCLDVPARDVSNRLESSDKKPVCKGQSSWLPGDLTVLPLSHTVYVRAHVCECRPICVLMSAKAGGHVWVSLLRRCSPNPCPLLRQSFLPSLELTDLLRLAGASKPQGPTCLCPQHWDHECLPHAWVSYMDARDGTPMLVHTKQVLC